jgi:hypothetical protein
VRYEPGSAGYFDQVLVELSRTFAVQLDGTVEVDSPIDVIELLRENVLEPLEAEVVGHYRPVRRERYEPVRDSGILPEQTGAIPVGV